ncbi:hypothetical protein FOA43_002980 [Brettanomyces nanus]|uniref:Iron transport multicopper oxidase FET3 n=1 Tax=Eeniella nana TaxID=13502 RepID=A0A875S3Z5_EENNA|nr:uncharacterized protein FOA43_002980 [Brettanomyces nanus]QPG75623.1 hypothetical protein FOA43_002980 [Brettanomyces nanus]
MKFTHLLSALVFAGWAFAEQKVHSYNWTAQWGKENPDGLYEREVVTCNGDYPWPGINVKKGDRIIISLTNHLENQNTSLHFHGLFQNGTNEYDGVPLMTQCEIPPNETMVYNFTVPDQAGTYWYHSHSSGQYMDGMRGSFVIEDTEDMPFDYDEEVVVSVSDWYHKTVSELTPAFMSLYNPTGAEPIPQTLLFNETFNGVWNVKPDTTYFLRIVNTGGFLSQYLWMEDHTFTVVAVDGVYVEPNETEIIYITAAQRYDVLIHTKNDTSKNYAFMQKMDEDMLDTLTGVAFINSTDAIVYNKSAPLPEEYISDNYDTDFLNDFYLVPVEPEELYEDYDYQIKIDVVMDNLGNGMNYAFFNNISYVAPKVPTLGTVLSADKYATNSLVYGESTHPIVLQKDEIVEIVLNNNDTGKHPFHLHGHVFQVVERGPSYLDEDEPVPYNESAPYDAPEYPMRRDTFYVNPQSYFVLRFKANNPGVWFFHCHIDWHLIQGLGLTIIEDPESIQAQQSLSDNWKDVCSAAGTPYIGNAANNTENYLNLKNQNVQVKNLPSGFTARGIVALVFSCIAGILGCVVICVYGMAQIPDMEKKIFDNLTADEQVLFLEEHDDDADDDTEVGGANGASGASGVNGANVANVTSATTAEKDAEVEENSKEGSSSDKN